MSKEAILEHLTNLATKMFEDTGEVMPIFILENKDGWLLPIITPFEGDGSKETVAKLVKEKSTNIDAQHIGFMCEAWVIEAKEGRLSEDELDGLKNGSLTPSEHPDRREVVHIVVESKDGSFVGGQFYILRPEVGKPRLSPFKKMPDGGKFTGRFSHLFAGAK